MRQFRRATARAPNAAHVFTYGLMMAPSRLFATSAVARMPTDPEELRREAELRAKLSKDPKAAFTGGQTNQQTSQTASSNEGQQYQSNPTGTPNSQANFWEAFNESVKRTSGPGGKPGMGNFWKQFEEFRKIRDQQRAAAAAGGGGGSGSANTSANPGFTPGAIPQRRTNGTQVLAWMIIVYVSLRLFFRSQGGDVTNTIIPYWVSSYDVQARYLLLSFLMPKDEVNRHQAGFAAARRARPLMTFWEYLDQVAPGWAAGSQYSTQEVVSTFGNALRTLSQWQVASLANRLSYALSGKMAKGSTTEKVDAIMDAAKSHLGSRLMPLMGQGSSPSNPMTVRLGNGEGGRPVMTLPDGRQLPVYDRIPAGGGFVSTRSYPLSEAPPGMLPPGMTPGGAPGQGQGMNPSFIIPSQGGSMNWQQQQQQHQQRGGGGGEESSGNHGTVPRFD